MAENWRNNNRAHLDLRTFYLGMLNGLFVILASAFLDPETVLPAFALEVIPGGKVIWVGIICSAINVGWFWPQIFLSRQMDTKQFLRPYYGLAQGLRTLCMLLICATLYFLAADHATLAFAIVVVLLFASTTGGAYGMIPFMRVFRDGLPPDWMGRFFGWRYMLGGLASFAVGFWIKDILSADSGVGYPLNYILIFAAGALAVALCGLFFSMIKEQPHTVARHTLPMRTHLARGQRLMRDNATLRRITKARALWAAGAGMAFPFVVPFAIKVLQMPVALVGVLLAVKMLAYTISNPLWGHLSGVLGDRQVMAVNALGQIGVPLLVVVSPYLPRTVAFAWLGVNYDYQLLAIVVVAILIGTSRAGLLVSINAFLLASLPGRKTTPFLGFYYLMVLPTMIVPLIGALIVGSEERFVLGMLLGALLSSVMLWEILRLPDTRL